MPAANGDYAHFSGAEQLRNSFREFVFEVLTSGVSDTKFRCGGSPLFFEICKSYELF